MSGGGYLQLLATNAMDEYFTSRNPELVYFKSVYRKYSHFGHSIIQLDNDQVDNTIKNFDDITTLKYKIPRNGNLVGKITLELELPSIYSNDQQQFQWIRRIGEYIIKEARIKGSSNYSYQRLSSEYIHIYNETRMSSGSKEEHYTRIGYIPELYDPATSNSGIYPSTTKPSSGDETRPSISKHRIVLNIPFWFTTQSGTALPLIAAQGDEFKIEIDIRPIKHLYTIIDTDPTSSTFNTRIRPRNQSNHYLSNFTNIANGNSLSSTNVNLYGDYIMLSEELLKAFAAYDHQYIIKELQYFNDDASRLTGGNHNVDLVDITKPVTQFFFMFRRKDNENTNQWNNFTLWEYNERDLVNPIKPNFISEYNNNFNTIDPSYSFSKDILSPDIVKTINFLINGTRYFNDYSTDLFKLTRGENNKNDSNELTCIYNYSFGVNNDDEYQPSGTYNFSVHDDHQLNLEFKNISSMVRKYGEPFTGEYSIIMIFESLNILEFSGGMSGLKYVS